MCSGPLMEPPRQRSDELTCFTAALEKRVCCDGSETTHLSINERSSEEKDVDVRDAAERDGRICAAVIEDITKLSASGVVEVARLWDEGPCDDEETLKAPPILTVGSFRLFLKENFCLGARDLRTSDNFSESALIC